MEPPAMTPPRSRVLAGVIDDVLGPILGPAPKVALVDFPNHRNVGDSAVWLGELAFLTSIGAELVYVADMRSYSRRHLARALGDGVVLLSGGGNFGDLWPAFQRLRERVIRDFPGTRIVQLPQTIHFERRENLERARSVLDSHPALTLLVRDTRSLERAQASFAATSALCPDMAFALGRLEPVPASTDLVLAAHEGAESAGLAAGFRRSGGEPEVVGWPSERVSGLRWPATRKLTKLAGRALARSPGVPRPASDALTRAFEALARERLATGVRALSRGRVVVTDRLHGHVLCLLLGRPHVLLDNSYGKVRAFYETWTEGDVTVRWCDRPEDAAAAARALASELSG